MFSQAKPFPEKKKKKKKTSQASKLRLLPINVSLLTANYSVLDSQLLKWP